MRVTDLTRARRKSAAVASGTGEKAELVKVEGNDHFEGCNDSCPACIALMTERRL